MALSCHMRWFEKKKRHLNPIGNLLREKRSAAPYTFKSLKFNQRDEGLMDGSCPYSKRMQSVCVCVCARLTTSSFFLLYR
jgi:hypothetical protein